MATSRNGSRVEVVPQVVLFDAMFCLFEARESRAAQLARIFREEAGITVTPARIWRVTQRIRRSLPPSSDYKRDWVFFNCRIIAELTGRDPAGVSTEVAERIQRRILWDQRLYEVRPDMRALLEWLHTCQVRLGIASNQDRAALDSMLEAFAVRPFFSEECIFTSDRIAGSGDVVSKPHEQFWSLVRQSLDLEAAAVPFVGNSLRNDAPATRFGHTVLLFDRCGHQHPHLPKETSAPLFFCWNPREIKRALGDLGLS